MVLKKVVDTQSQPTHCSAPASSLTQKSAGMFYMVRALRESFETYLACESLKAPHSLHTGCTGEVFTATDTHPTA